MELLTCTFIKKERVAALTSDAFTGGWVLFHKTIKSLLS